MRTALLFCCALLCLTSTAEAQYSNASLDGPWLLVVSGVETYDYAVYVVFDGQGSITDMGSFNTPDSAGSYTVNPDGAISGFIWSDGYAPFTGQMQTDSTAVVNFGSLVLPLLKVMDRGACSGSWKGQFVQDGTSVTYQVTMTIDSSGEIVSCAGFAPPVEGRFFSQSGYLAGNFTTGESAPGWEEVMLQDADLLGGRMFGRFGLDCSACNGGSFELVRTSSSVCEAVMPLLELQQNRPNPFSQRTAIAFTLGERARVRLSVHDVAGRQVRTLVDETLPSGTARVDWNGRGDGDAVLGSGVYYLRLQSGTHATIRRVVLMR